MSDEQNISNPHPSNQQSYSDTLKFLKLMNDKTNKRHGKTEMFLNKLVNDNQSYP